MAEEETDDFEEDDFVDEDETAIPPLPKQTDAKKPIGRPRIQQPVKKVEPIEEEDTYVAYHISESTGIANKKTNQIVGNDVYSILAKILSKVEKIERATC